MLEALCGNQTIEKILFFLLVNNKCYGVQLHRLLDTALTPLQKGLQRLEKGGVITSSLEGKTRIYLFNPAFPMLSELEQLLKKAYSLLPQHEKKKFYVQKDLQGKSPQENKGQVVLRFWKMLTGISQLTFLAKTRSKEEYGWNGKGKGEVGVVREGENVLVFSEKGSWKDREGREVGFTNVFRWTLDRRAALISLEHLRRGPEHPVFLMHLEPSGSNAMSSVDSHLCESDSYFGRLHIDCGCLRLSWRVIGPKKNEEMDYFYSSV
ncbi:MAG: DUF6314 family protein [Chlamydiota bacterium]